MIYIEMLFGMTLWLALGFAVVTAFARSYQEPVPNVVILIMFMALWPITAVACFTFDYAEGRNSFLSRYNPLAWLQRLHERLSRG